MAEEKRYINPDTPVFISYTGKDEELVKRFISLLDEKHIYHRDSITEDIDVISEFENEIGEGKVVVIFYSSAYFRSFHCMNEYKLIRNSEEGKKIYTVRCENFVFDYKYVEYELTELWGGRYARLKRAHKFHELKPSEQAAYENYCYIDDSTKYCIYQLGSYFSDTKRKDIEALATQLNDLFLEGTNKTVVGNSSVVRSFDRIEFSYDKPVTTSNEPKEFFGRKKYVENLHSRFFEQGLNCINVVAKGGMGKTSIAYIYVRDYGNEYKNIQFVVCNDDILSDFNDELRRRICKVDYYASKYPRLEDIIQRENTEEERKIQKLKVCEDINAVLSDADSNSKNLLVIDVNVDQVGLQSIYMPQDVKDKWHILYLSREPIVGTLKLPLYNFKDQDDDFEGAKGLFEHIYTRKQFEKKDLEKLFDSIYYHPLLIEQLAAYGMDAEFDEYQNFCDIVAEGSAEITENFSQYTIYYKGKEHDIMRYINKLFNIGRYKEEEQYVIMHFASWEYDFIHFSVIDKLLNIESKKLKKTLNDLVDKVILLKSNETDSYRIHGLLKEKLKDDIKKYKGFGDYFDKVRDIIENDGVDKEVEKCIKNIDAVYLPWLEKQPHPCLPSEQTDEDGYTFVNIPLTHYGTIKMMKVRDGFYIAETQVTQSLWETVMKGTKLQNPSNFNNGGLYPVERVSWYDCIAFIMRLNKATGFLFRLPTSDEWGAAAGRHKYSGTDNEGLLSKFAWYINNSQHTTHEVATRLPNELGIYDMSGNVWEWCQDWNEDWNYSSWGPARVLRGGTWYCDARLCRVSNRSADNPAGRRHENGLRLLLISPKKEEKNIRTK